MLVTMTALALVVLVDPHARQEPPPKQDEPELLANLLLDSEEKPFAILFEKLKAHHERAVALMESELAKKPPSKATPDAQNKLGQRQARAAVALVRLGRGEKV